MPICRWGWPLLLLLGCSPPSATSPVSIRPIHPVTEADTSAPVEAQIKAFCGHCHAFPNPAIFPRDAWPSEIERGIGLYWESGRSDLNVPKVIDVVRYYRARAPAALEIPLPEPDSGSPPVTFRRSDGEAGDKYLLPATSNILYVPARDGQPPCLLTCDMRSGEVRRVKLLDADTPGELLAQLGNPAHVEECDLDRDGFLDLLIADLGSLEPADHKDGKVIWLRWNDGAKEYQPRVLADGLGRVADVRPADFNGDGKLDLVVGEFGWHHTGKIFLLLQEGESDDTLRFRRQILDPHPGAIHVPPCDLNGDGHLDIVALISQDQESIVAFLNQGDGTFSRETIWEAGDPSFGSSGLELVDLDQDGDLDVLYTNGDTFDNMHIKPYHAVHWIENDGGFPFRHHVLATLPGAYRALAGDLDGDGDLDVVAVAFLPHEPLTPFDIERQQSVILLDQVSPGQFRRFGLETGRFDHATFVMHDLDNDGDLDLAIGESPRNGATPHPRFRFWWNERLQPDHQRKNR